MEDWEYAYWFSPNGKPRTVKVTRMDNTGNMIPSFSFRYLDRNYYINNGDNTPMGVVAAADIVTSLLFVSGFLITVSAIHRYTRNFIIPGVLNYLTIVPT